MPDFTEPHEEPREALLQQLRREKRQRRLYALELIAVALVIAALLFAAARGSAKTVPSSGDGAALVAPSANCRYHFHQEWDCSLSLEQVNGYADYFQQWATRLQLNVHLAGKTPMGTRSLELQGVLSRWSTKLHKWLAYKRFKASDKSDLGKRSVSWDKSYNWHLVYPGRYRISGMVQIVQGNRTAISTDRDAFSATLLVG